MDNKNILRKVMEALHFHRGCDSGKKPCKAQKRNIHHPFQPSGRALATNLHSPLLSMQSFLVL